MKLVRDLRGITCDSREVEPGYAFVAIQGLKRDGHEFIEDALSRGASLIVTEKPIQISSNVPVWQVEDGRVALAEIASALNDYPSKKLKTIGVTGTNGKTTTTFLLHHLFNQNGVGCGLIGTVDIDTGLQKLKAQLTTPDSVKLQRYLREMVDTGLDAVAMEVSSHGIELRRTYGIDFDLAIFTNVTADHFDFHKGFESYLATKKRLFQQLSSDAVALVNQDDPHAGFIMDGLRAKVITYGTYSDAVIRAENIRQEHIKTFYDLVVSKPIETKFVRLKPMRIPIEIKMPGKHNIYNTLAACSASLLMGFAPEEVQNVANFAGVWRRLHIIHNEDYLIIDDCAHNPGSYTAVFETVRDLTYNNLFIINAIRGNRGTEINQRNAETIGSWTQKLRNARLFVTNCREMVKEDDLVSPAEESVFLQTLREHGVTFEHSQDLHQQFERVLGMVRDGDLVLLLGAHAMDQAGELILQNICSEALV